MLKPSKWGNGVQPPKQVGGLCGAWNSQFRKLPSFCSHLIFLDNVVDPCTNNSTSYIRRRRRHSTCWHVAQCEGVGWLFNGFNYWQTCDIRKRNVTIRSETWTKNICSLWFWDIREWVTCRRLTLQSLGCISPPSLIGIISVVALIDENTTFMLAKGNKDMSLSSALLMMVFVQLHSRLLKSDYHVECGEGNEVMNLGVLQL